MCCMLLLRFSPWWCSTHTAGRKAWWLPPGQPLSPHWLNGRGTDGVPTELEIKHTYYKNSTGSCCHREAPSANFVSKPHSGVCIALRIITQVFHFTVVPLSLFFPKSPLHNKRQLELDDLQKFQTVGHPHHQGAQAWDHLLPGESPEVLRVWSHGILTVIARHLR